MKTYTEGICEDGAAILRDGKMIPVEHIVDLLNEHERFSYNQCLHPSGIIGDEGGSPCCPVTGTRDASWGISQGNNFLDELESLCKKFKIQIAASDYGAIQIWDLEDDDKPFYSEIEDKLMEGK